MRVHQVMTEKVSFVDPNMRIPEIARRMRDEDIGSLPVAEESGSSVSSRTATSLCVPSPRARTRAKPLRGKSCRQRSSTASKTTASRTH